MWVAFSQFESEFGNVGFWGEGKTSQNKDANQQKIQPTYMYDAQTKNQTQDTLVWGSALNTVPSLLLG